MALKTYHPSAVLGSMPVALSSFESLLTKSKPEPFDRLVQVRVVAACFVVLT
jgi:hypothetical protein